MRVRLPHFAALAAVAAVAVTAVAVQQHGSGSAPAAAAGSKLVETPDWQPVGEPPAVPEVDNLTGRFIPRAAPYVYFAWGNPQDPVAVMRATGLRWFSVSFILAKGGCHPAWDGERPLRGSLEARQIGRIRAAGGDVIAVFGGADGTKLSQACGTPAQLANAYREVVDTYQLRAIDLNVESSEITTPALRNKVIDALAVLRRSRPALRISFTSGDGERGGYDPGGLAALQRAGRIGLRLDSWNVMAFDRTDNRRIDMAAETGKVIEGLRAEVQAAYHITAAQAYNMIGLIAMNGLDDNGEVSNQAVFERLLGYARSRHFARFSFWAINRDRACASGHPNGADNCSGVSQGPLDFTRITARYTG
jgi:chitinase